MKTRTLYHINSLLVLALFFIQCSKSDEITTTKPIQPQLSAFDQKIHNMVNDFKTKLNSDLKSGEIMSMDSAIWYISTTINTTYGNPANGTLSPQKTHIDTINTDLSSYNGSLSIEEINNLYTEILDSIRLIYYGITEEDKQFGALIYNNQSAGLKSSNSSTSVNWIIITYSTWGLNTWELFGPSESYYYAWQDEANNPVNPNACGKLEEKFYSHVAGNPNSVPYPGYHWVNSGEGYTVNATEYPYNYVNGTFFTNLFDFYLFHSCNFNAGYHETLHPTEMNFHLSKIIELADEILPVAHNINISETYRCYQTLLGYTRCFDGESKTISHSVHFIYGYRVANIIPPKDL